MTTTTQRTHLSRALTILLCVLMLLSLAMPVGAASGHWKEVKIRTSYGNVSTHAYVLDSPAKNCASFDLDVEIEMKKNTSCANWDIWIRSNGSFVNVASLSLSGGNGSASKTVKLKPARDFDAVAITPTKRGNYSWSLGMAVSNISGSSSDNSSGSSSDNSDSSSSDKVTLLDGDFEKVKIRTGSSSYNVHALVLDTPLKKVRSIGVAINVSMKKNTHCYNWDVWVRTGGSFKKVGSISLPDGDGYTDDTVYFDSATSFDAIAVIPNKPGGYSWSISMGVFNPK